MKSLTKKALVFIFAMAVVFCGISGIFAVTANNEGEPVSSFNADKTVDFTGVEGYWLVDGFDENDDRPSGDGSSGTPYLIFTAEELAWVSSKLHQGAAGLHVKLENDIDLSAHFWTPLNYVTNLVFDGNGNTISNVSIDSEGDEYVGFFGNLQSSEIKNLNFNNPQVYSFISSGSTGNIVRYAGIIAGCTTFVNFNNCNITNGKVIIDFQGDNYYSSFFCGSIVASGQYSLIKDCSVDAVVFQSAAEENMYDHGIFMDSCIGGLAGYLGILSDIENSTFTGKVIYNDENSNDDSTSSSKVGGLVGSFPYYAHTIINSSFSGEIKCYDYYGDSVVGGIVGEADSGIVLTNCYSIGQIYSYSRGSENVCGGLLGDVSEANITNSYVIMDIEINSADAPYVGGLVGICDNFKIDNQLDINNCYVSVAIDLSDNITNYNNIKYLVGYGNAAISNSYYNSDKKIIARGIELNTNEDGGITESYLKSQGFTDVLNEFVQGKNDYAEWAIDLNGVKNNGFPYFADQTFVDIIEVTFDYQYDNIKTSINETVGSTYKLPQEHKRPGYVFDGWWTKKGIDNDWGVEITAEKNCNRTDFLPDETDFTVYAKWTEVEFTINVVNNCEIFNLDSPVSSGTAILWSELSDYTIDVVGGDVQQWLVGINNGQLQPYSSTNNQLTLKNIIENLYANSKLNYQDLSFEIDFSATLREVDIEYFSVKLDIKNLAYGTVNFNNLPLMEGVNTFSIEEGTTVNFNAFVQQANILKYECIVEFEDAEDWQEFTETSFTVNKDYNLRVIFSKIEYKVKISFYNPIAKSAIDGFIIEDLLIITMVSDNFTIAAGDSIAISNKYNIFNNYKFINFTIDGSEESYSKIQFDSIDSVLKYANGDKEILIKANFIRVFSISIQDQQSLRGKAIVWVRVNGTLLNSSNMRFDEGSDIHIEILVLTAAGYKIDRISFDGTAYVPVEGTEFMDNFDAFGDLIIHVDIYKVDPGNVMVKLISNTAGSGLQPSLNSNKYDAINSKPLLKEYLFNFDEQNIGKISVGQSAVYILKGWNIYLNGDLFNDVSGIFELDEFGNIQSFNLNALVTGLDGDIEVEIEAVWKKIAGIEIAYAGDSDMGGVVVSYSKDGGTTWVPLSGNDLLSLQIGQLLDVGDKVKIVLTPDKYYVSADKNGFTNGEKIITIAEGIAEVLVEFKPKTFNMGDKQAALGENLMFDLEIGFLYKLDTFSITIDGKVVDKNLVKATNNSLIVAVDKAFIDAYLSGAGELDFSYNTKLNPGIVAMFVIIGVVVAAVVVLLILYSIAVANKKHKIKVAEQETAEGNARFNAASQFSKLRDEE